MLGGSIVKKKLFLILLIVVILIQNVVVFAEDAAEKSIKSENVNVFVIDGLDKIIEDISKLYNLPLSQVEGFFDICKNEFQKNKDYKIEKTDKGCLIIYVENEIIINPDGKIYVNGEPYTTKLPLESVVKKKIDVSQMKKLRGVTGSNSKNKELNKESKSNEVEYSEEEKIEMTINLISKKYKVDKKDCSNYIESMKKDSEECNFYNDGTADFRMDKFVKVLIDGTISIDDVEQDADIIKGKVLTKEDIIKKNLSKEKIKHINKIKQAVADYYKVAYKDAANYVDKWIEDTYVVGGIEFDIQDNGTLLFKSIQKYKIMLDGTIFVNGKDIRENIFKKYDDEGDLVELIAYFYIPQLYEEKVIARGYDYTKEIFDDYVLLTVYATVVEINEDGTIYKNGELMDAGMLGEEKNIMLDEEAMAYFNSLERENIVDNLVSSMGKIKRGGDFQALKSGNIDKLASPEKARREILKKRTKKMPTTGESSYTLNYIYGTLIILIGMLMLLMVKRHNRRKSIA
jgi:hypothetical protein